MALCFMLAGKYYFFISVKHFTKSTCTTSQHLHGSNISNYIKYIFTARLLLYFANQVQVTSFKSKRDSEGPKLHPSSKLKIQSSNEH